MHISIAGPSARRGISLALGVLLFLSLVLQVAGCASKSVPPPSTGYYVGPMVKKKGGPGGIPKTGP